MHKTRPTHTTRTASRWVQIQIQVVVTFSDPDPDLDPESLALLPLQ